MADRGAVPLSQMRQQYGVVGTDDISDHASYHSYGQFQQPQGPSRVESTHHLLGSHVPGASSPPSYGYKLGADTQLFDVGQPSQPLSRNRLSQHDWWAWEILAMAMSVLCWAAVVGILLAVNNKELDKVWKSSISLNAIVSVLAAVGRGAMLVGVSASLSQGKWLWFKRGNRNLYDMHYFDSASRSILGSIRFMFRVRWQLSTLAAVITILSVLVDPFAQQVISMEPTSIGVDEGTAGFLFAHNYSANAVENAQATEKQPVQCQYIAMLYPSASHH